MDQPTSSTVERGRVRMPGYEMAFYAAGEGTRSVVLDGGLGGASDYLVTVQTQAAGFARVWRYDRPGLGASTAAPKPRTSEDLLADLRGLLVQAAIPKPCVLVGASMAGPSVILYAHRYPDEVAGLVLVDPAHHDEWQAFEELLYPARDDEAPGVAEFRADIETVKDPATNPEGIDLYEQTSQVQKVTSLGELPIAVLTSGSYLIEGDLGPVVGPALYRTLRRGHEKYASLSSRSRHTIHEDVGHSIPRHRPELVVDAIRWVVSSSAPG